MIYQKINDSKYNLYYIGALFLSLSVSAIVIFILLYLFLPIFIKKVFNYKRFFRIFSFISIVIMTLIYYYIVMHNSDLRNLSDNKFVNFKLVSMSIRFDVQSNAIKRLIKEDKLLLGFGAGTAKKMNDYGLNLHNTYLQMLFEIGLLGILLFFCFFIIIFWQINIAFIPILSFIFLLGNIMEIFYFPLISFIFFLSNVYENNLIRRLKKNEIFFDSSNYR